MKRYIVKGKNIEALVAKVARHFQVDPREVKYEILRKNPEFELKIWIEKNGKDPISKDEFKIDVEDDGIYLTIIEVDEKKALTLKRILKGLEEKKIKDFDLDKVEKSLYNLNTKTKIAEYDKEYYIDSEVVVEVINNMEASILITKPVRGRDATVEQVLEICEEKGIVFGIRKKAIKTLIEEKIYDKRAILAKGKEPVHGQDARIIYTFKGHHDDKVEENKSIDFKKLDLITNVEEDEVLGKKIEVVEGEDGVDIFGKIIKAKNPKDITFPSGKNTKVSEDGIYLKSLIDGQIVMKGKVVTVEPILTISGNVDYSTGNIDFVGVVIVKGNVLAGFEVKAEGDIYVEGLVEDAKLYSTGQIVVSNGILGNEEQNNNIYAQEGIKAKFIQNMNVKTKGVVEVDKHILHSHIEAKGKVIVTTGQGIIIGGEVISQEGIEANVAGGKYETPTKLSIAIFGDTIAEESAINTEMLLLEENKFKLERIINDLSDKKELLKDKFKDKLEECLKQLVVINNRYELLEGKRDNIEGEKSEIRNKKITVLQKVFPGVIVRIGRELLLNRSEKIKTEFYIDRETMEITER